jgi:lipoate-protein ligase A
MHGEYKVPGGKLVVADLEVRNGRLAAVEISGDFFLEPAEALDRIAAAIENLPADSGDAAITEAIRRGIGPGVEMIGFSPEAVATAVGRALHERQ